MLFLKLIDYLVGGLEATCVDSYELLGFGVHYDVPDHVSRMSVEIKMWQQSMSGCTFATHGVKP